MRLEQQPMDLDARMRLARTYRLLSKPDDAVSHYGAVARYLSLSGHPHQAVAVLRELLQVNPRHDETLLFLSKLSARKSLDVTAGSTEEPVVSAFADRFPSGSEVWESVDAGAIGAVIDDIEDADAVGAEVIPPSTEGAALLEQHLSSAEDVVGDGAMPPPLPVVPLFSGLPPDAMSMLGRSMVLSVAPAGSVIFSIGQDADSCIVIVSGQASIGTSTDISIQTLTVGDVAGLSSLWMSQTGNGEKRKATMRADTEVTYWEIDRRAVTTVIAAYPEARRAFRTAWRDRLLVHFAVGLPSLASVPIASRLVLCDRFSDKQFDVGDELLYAGEEHDGLFILVEGECLVTSGEDDKSGPHVLLRPGDLVAHLAGLRDAGADVAVIAKTAVRAAFLGHKAVHELMTTAIGTGVPTLRDTYDAAGEHVLVGSVFPRG
jgi:CRP-like cAMP-binding protein